jgi:hypothetical protein
MAARNRNRITGEDQIPFAAEVYSAVIEIYRDDPVGFAEDILRFPALSSWQREMFERLSTDVQKMGVYTGQGVGKTSATAAFILFYMVMAADRTVIMTSSSEGQLERVAWPTLTTLIQRSRIADWFSIYGETIELKSSQNVTYKVAWSENAPDRFQGQHVLPGAPEGAGIMFVFDEASNLPETILQASLMSMDNKYCKLLMTGNPLRRKGAFYESSLSPFWYHIHVNSENIAYTNHEIHRQYEEEYGRDSNFYRVRVLGQFPLSDSDAWFTEGNTQWSAIPDNTATARAIAGLDLAAGGDDDTVLVIRKGRNVTLVRTWHGSNSLEIYKEAAQICADHQVDTVTVDANGVGWGAYQHLRADTRFKTLGIVGDPKSSVPNMYSNKRTEMYGRLSKECARLRMAETISPTVLKELKRELLATRYDFAPKTGVFKLQPKAVIRRDIGRSPDYADALAMTFAYHGIAKSEDTMQPSLTENKFTYWDLRSKPSTRMW